MNVRPATSQDLDALSRLVNSAYRGESSKKGWTTEEHLLGGQRTDPKSLAETIANPGSVILLLFQEDQMIGCVNLQKREGSTYLGMLTIDPTLQAGGIGRQLLQLGEQWARKNWLSTKMEMTVISVRKELIAWYERRGYQLTSRREPFPYGDERFGQPKVAGLEFIILEKNL